ncbi:MAG TPA: hypothetical protein VE954_29650 [Oligoflexus sp.]|uniref:hypothetical protein n=1 Tax=Oligoflexus sp. TaxID=1971216 RepID=UPI002D3148C0|nr:hypothetical protein [Oligoflexus sp.]HYX37290.1 hypothetical protein [Oligoflexus sp.]
MEPLRQVRLTGPQRAKKSYLIRKKGYSVEQALLEIHGSELNTQAQPYFGQRSTSVNIQLEVEKPKPIGLMTEITERHEVNSDAQVLPIRKPDKINLLANPSQPIFVPLPTQAQSWKAAKQNILNPDVSWLCLVACGIGTLLCSAALITYSAQAGGNTGEAWFWSALIVISSSILLSLPMDLLSLKAWIQKVLGFFLITIGYTTMHASIKNTEQHAVSVAVAGTTEVQQLEKRILDIEAQLAPTRIAMARLDPVQYRTLISRIHTGAKPLETELSATRDSLVSAQNKAIMKASGGSASSWSLVEWLRRLMLEPLNILCLHGFLEGLPGLTKVLRDTAFTLRERRMKKKFRVGFAR